MARGLCVDCNYDGPLEPMGDCPRCGSEWTTSSDKKRIDDDGLDSLLGRVTSSTYASESYGETPYYEL